jgi:hypothetical protein
MKPLKDARYWDYAELVDSMEVSVLLKVEEDNYQGDSYYLVKDGDRHGLLTFGWGSCPGCDALEACSTVAEATELRDQIFNQIHWEPTPADLLAYMDTKDWSLDWTWHDAEGKQFLADAKAHLVAIVRGEQPS